MLLLTVPAIIHSAADHFRLNQLGYYPQSRKVAVVVGAQAGDFNLVCAREKEIVFSGTLSEQKTWEEAGETGRQADFSEFKEVGTYKISVEGIGESHPFNIAEDVLEDVATASMRSYYFQRCSYELLEQFAGQWARPAGHPDTAVSFHESSGRTSGTLNSPGGWYDAGDYGKYIVNSGISTGTLLAFYELFPDYFPDGSLHIPESGNGVPDILDEVRFNIDWMKTMQDEDGGVFFKLTTLRFPGYIMPHEDTWERFVIGKSTTSSLNFAAVMAMAARIYEPFDPQFAKDAKKSAKRAWDWAVENPSVRFQNPSDVRTGEYGDSNFSDEFVWAATELYITTNDKKFADFLSDKDLSYMGAPSWRDVHSLAALSLSVRDDRLSEELREEVRRSVVNAADAWIGDMSRSLYRIPDINFNWGSNSVYANAGISMVYAYKITGEVQYLLAAAEVADYLLGKNATTFSFMTGFGTKAAAHPHHRPSIADKDAPSVPGFLVGGPNASRQDSSYAPYSSRLPAKSFEDDHRSYASNEVAINWNAPSTFLLAALHATLSEDIYAQEGPFRLNTNIAGNGSVTVTPQKQEYELGDKVTFSAQADDGSVFSHWSGAVIGTESTVEITINSNLSVTAVFTDPDEMVRNGDFSSGFAHWHLGVYQNASASGAVSNEKFHVDITNGGDEVWNIQLTQRGINLQKGHTYRLEFDAYAEEPRNLMASVSMSNDPWSSYVGGTRNVFRIGKEEESYSLTFTMQAESDSDARIEINYGTDDAAVYLDNVSFREVTE